jgi:hypothetical protein
VDCGANRVAPEYGLYGAAAIAGGDVSSTAVAAPPDRCNGSQLTDRFTSKSKRKEPGGQHVFDRLCKQFGIDLLRFFKKRSVP